MAEIWGKGEIKIKFKLSFPAASSQQGVVQGAVWEGRPRELLTPGHRGLLFMP